MKNSKLMLAGLRNGVLALIYIICVASIMTEVGKYGDAHPGKGTLTIVVMISGFLSLFVISALIEGAAVLGQPILMFVQGEKSDAFKLLGYTVATMGLALLAIGLYVSL